jgi:hypothetical protein
VTLIFLREKIHNLLHPFCDKSSYLLPLMSGPNTAPEGERQQHQDRVDEPVLIPEGAQQETPLPSVDDENNSNLPPPAAATDGIVPDESQPNLSGG